MELREYEYNGKLIPDTCIERNTTYEEFEKRFNRMRNNKKLDIYSDEYLIDYIFRNFYPIKSRTNSPFASKYFVDDDPLAEYARKNGVLTISVRGAVQKGVRANPNADTTKIAKDFVERNRNKIIYRYDNYPLSIALRRLNINRSTIMNIFYDIYPNYKDMSQEEVDAAIKGLVDAYLKKKEKKEEAKLKPKTKRKTKGLKYEL